MQNTVKRVLMIDDDADYRLLVKRYLNKSLSNAEFVEYDPVSQGRPPDDFGWSGFDLLILDYNLTPTESGLDWLRAYKTPGAFPATILLTGGGNEEVAVRALKYGAHDYLRKDGLTAKRFSQSIVEAISTRAKENAELNSMTLQGSIFNKSLFYTRLETAARESSTRDQRALMLVELDDADALRAAHGLLVVDNLTRHVAKTVVDAFKDNEEPPNVTRFGDASVAVLVADYDSKSELETIAEHLSAHLGDHPYSRDGDTIPFTVSIGVVPLSTRSAEPPTILGQADIACGAARAESGNSYHLYGAEHTESVAPAAPEAQPAVDEAAAPLFDAQAAFKDNRLINYFQPVVAISERGTQEGMEIYEVRVRMVRLDGELVEPGEFMQAVVQQGLERLLDRWSLRECIGRLVEAREKKLTFLIRITPPSLAEKGLGNWMEKLVKHVGRLNPNNCIGMEIAHQDFIAHETQAVTLIERLRDAHHCRFCLLDVETAGRLEAVNAKAAIDYIKLTPELNRELTEGGEEAGAAQHIIAKARELGVLTIAERIEDVATLSAVISAGADFVQGYFVGMPQTELAESSLVESFEF